MSMNRESTKKLLAARPQTRCKVWRCRHVREAEVVAEGALTFQCDDVIRRSRVSAEKREQHATALAVEISNTDQCS